MKTIKVRVTELKGGNLKTYTSYVMEENIEEAESAVRAAYTQAGRNVLKVEAV